MKKTFFSFLCAAVLLIDQQGVFAASSHTNVRLAILPPAPPTQPEEETTGVPGAVPKLPIIQPGTAEKIFVRPEEGFVPYVVVSLLSRREAPPDELSWTYERNPVFFGKTNIKHATIFLQYRDFPEIIFTTFADDLGRWQMQPGEYLNFGWHEISVLAMSPLNAGIRAETHFLFQVLPLPSRRDSRLPVFDTDHKPLPSERTSEVMPFLPAPTNKDDRLNGDYPKRVFPKMPDGGYALDIKIAPETKQIPPSGAIQARTEILYIPKAPEREKNNQSSLDTIEYRIYNDTGEIVYQDSEDIHPQQQKRLIKKFQTTPWTSPGDYEIEVRVEKDDSAYIARDSFEVKESFPSDFQAGFSREIFQIFGFLLLIVLFSLLLFFWEYRQSAQSRTVDEDHLRRRGMIK